MPISRPSLWRRALDAWRRDGFPVAAANGVRKLGGRPLARLQNVFDGRIDRRFGLDTRGVVHPADMPFANPHKEHATNYQPTTARTFRTMMALLPRSLAGFDFVDIGEVIRPTNVVPLVIKSLLFSGPGMTK